jgi:putative flavoprotein involved in K+ transport
MPNAWLARFQTALTEGPAQAAECFAPGGFWRDLAAFTWNIITLEGRDAIAAMLAETKPRATQFRLDPAHEATETEAWILFETATGRGRGHLRLKDGLAHTLLTALHELKGHEEKRGETREEGMTVGVVRGRRSWLQEREQLAAELGITRDPYVLVVGGGQGGLGLGARLKRLGVPTLIVDKHERPGDAWRKRYKSLCLHDTVWYDHMPYLPFPDHWPVYSPKDKIGDWLEMYAKIMELDIWNSTTCTNAAYDAQAGKWTVEVLRNGQPHTLHPTHLVLATGMSGFPNIPNVPGKERFRGRWHHSSQHRGGEGHSGQRCIVVGSNNSAHDIAADLWEHGAEVTMIQRSSTLVAKQTTLRRLAQTGVYSEAAAQAGLSTETADLTVASLPYKLQPDAQRPIAETIARDDADFYAALRAKGFLLDFGDDGSGLGQKYVRRGSGYYIDVGASDMIIDGRITLHSAVSVQEMTETGLILSDGTELEADLIVFATGYGSMNGWAAQLISQDVADRVGLVWGLGSNTTKDPGPWEGELRNMWKPTRQEALWFHGGNLAQSRHYSRYLALQLKARLEGIPTPVYGLPVVHHKG